MIDFLIDLGSWFADSVFELETAHGTAVPGWIPRLWEHLQISVATMLVATTLAIPIGAWFGHTHRGGVAIPAMVNIGRALPSFGIVALALPITIRIADAVPFIDSGLGFFPTFVALLALALPPIFTNTSTAVSGVDPEIVEAARGMGLTEERLLREVELPLALPIILTGVRLSAVAVVATAPLGALVAFGGLGRFIIDGFAIQDDIQIVAGALLVAGLSVLTEVAFSIVERLAVAEPLRTERRTRRPEAAEAGIVI